MGNPRRDEPLDLSVVVWLVAWVGCYRPTVLDGGFLCAPGSKPCPDGFACEPTSMTCRKTGSFDGSLPAADSGAGDALADAGVPSPDVACFAPVAGCTPDPGLSCDPICQTGCGCREKCLVNAAGALVCNALLGNARKAVGESCTISAAGTSGQTDNCDVGLVCVADSCGGRCYRFCQGDADCPGSTCSRDAGGGVKMCDVPFVTCDPVGGGTRSSCPSSAAMVEGCYLSAIAVDKTLCDCPFGAARENDSCTLSRECLPGLACVDATGTGDARCLPVCMLLGNGGCSNGRTCAAIGAGTIYGYCHP
jgi:hypothetical protein